MKFVAILTVAILAGSVPAIAHESVEAVKPKPAAPQGQQSQQPQTPQHSGGTDANGCHTNHSTGVYHCHRPK
ncbi:MULTISPECIES: YHYH domain-containing protein [unclassified Novosphingobium]|uniref:YHYH domain-containing protein n=1 Tax=unclassified Novosphingobium TaxID=2644732 RepID=UPI001358A5E6|nr:MULTISPECIES: YHYH domain-containing protein [unclassified Novosphingobium]